MERISQSRDNDSDGAVDAEDEFDDDDDDDEFEDDGDDLDDINQSQFERSNSRYAISEPKSPDGSDDELITDKKKRGRKPPIKSKMNSLNKPRTAL